MTERLEDIETTLPDGWHNAGYTEPGFNAWVRIEDGHAAGFENLKDTSYLDRGVGIGAFGSYVEKAIRTFLESHRKPKCETCEDTGEAMRMECYGGRPSEVMGDCPDCPKPARFVATVKNTRLDGSRLPATLDLRRKDGSILYSWTKREMEAKWPMQNSIAHQEFCDDYNSWHNQDWDIDTWKTGGHGHGKTAAIAAHLEATAKVVGVAVIDNTRLTKKEMEDLEQYLVERYAPPKGFNPWVCQWHRKRIKHPIPLPDFCDRAVSSNDGFNALGGQVLRIEREREQQFFDDIATWARSSINEWPTCPRGEVTIDETQWRCTCQDGEP